MSNTPWKTDKWFVSPWNFNPAVNSEFKFAKNIKFHDVTLRDGEQQTGVIFTKDDKIRIAEGLAEAGVHRIEVPSSEHIIKYAYKWSLEKAIDLSIESTKYAHEQGLEVVFFPIDFSRAEMNWVLDLIVKVATQGHMDALALVDTFGVLSPHAIQYLVRSVKARIDKRLEAHFHMDFGMGVANTIMALAEGVEVVHSTVLGLGERAGNVPMEDTAMALLTLRVS